MDPHNSGIRTHHKPHIAGHAWCKMHRLRLHQGSNQGHSVHTLHPLCILHTTHQYSGRSLLNSHLQCENHHSGTFHRSNHNAHAYCSHLGTVSLDNTAFHSGNGLGRSPRSRPPGSPGGSGRRPCAGRRSRTRARGSSTGRRPAAPPWRGRPAGRAGRRRRGAAGPPGCWRHPPAQAPAPGCAAPGSPPRTPGRRPGRPPAGRPRPSEIRHEDQNVE
mmetsp:Transcript_13106/g.23318  ORF Transcript_13106/g.23318 Transcript_13106/m.23318 type:complete len:217 (+) Transcript_13106:256-906(+)